MRKLNLTFPQEISEELSLVCLNRPKICKKQGQMGWSSNDRIILVRKGYFQYYNLHPGFVEDDLQSLKQRFFKAAVRLDFIHEVNFLPKNKIRKNFLELTFPKNKKVIRMPTEQKEQQWMGEEVSTQQQLEKWLFEFKVDIKEQVQKKRLQERQKMLANSKLVPLSPKEMRLFDNRNTPPATPTKKSSDQHHEKNIQQYVQIIQKTKSHLKSKAQIAQEQALRKKKLKEKEMAQMLSTKNQNSQETFGISNFWREYYRFYQLLMKSQKQKASLVQIIQNQLSLLRTIQYFNTAAVKTVQNYIDERCVGWNGLARQFQNFHYYQGLWLKLGGKQINQEFLVNYFLNDILYTFREVKELKFRIPLMSFIKYKGHKVLVMCDMPFSELEKSEIYNLLDQGFDLQTMSKLKQGLEIIEDVLNVKSEAVQVEPRKKVVAPLGLGLKVFEYNFKKDKSQDQASLPNFYYLINPGIVFPLDYLAQKVSLQPYARLRPNIVAFYRDYYKGSDPQLVSQAFMTSALSQDAKKYEDEKVIQASKLIQTYKIKELAYKLNQLELLLVDSYSIKSILQEMGINIRYLKNLYDAVSLPYLREHILVQALARTIKKQFRAALNQLQQQQFYQHAEQYSKMKSKPRSLLVTQRRIQSHNKYKAIAVDYLNLIFGLGKESEEFWNIIIKNCRHNYRLVSQYPPKVKPGMLLHAVLWHCGLKAKFQTKIPLFQTQSPFSQANRVEYVVKVKTLDFPSFQIQKLFRGAPSIEDRITMDLFKQSSAKLIKFEFLFQNTLRFSFLEQAAIAKLSNFSEYMQKIKLDSPYHPILLPYYLGNKSQYNFKNALQVLNFSLPQTHPLYISFYYQYSMQFQNDLLRKTSLLLAVKTLGEFHRKTTELYSQYYHEGYNEYRVKALRVGNLNACQLLCQQMFDDKRFQSCLIYCVQQMAKLNNNESPQKLGTGNYSSYLSILMNGLQSSIRINQLKKGLEVSVQISKVISSFKLRDHDLTYELFKRTLQIQLTLSPKKYFLYKMMLFTLNIRQQYESVQKDSDGCAEPVDAQQRLLLLEGLLNEYYQYENHSNWIQFVLNTIYKSFQYFNFLEDLFNNFAYHLERYNNQPFKYCLGYWDIFIRIYGQGLFKKYLYDVNLV